MDGVFRAVDVPEDIIDAIKCVTKTFDKALTSGDHAPGDWRELGEAGLWKHLSGHYKSVIIQSWHNIINDKGDDHLANLCCRALMLLQRREESRK